MRRRPYVCIIQPVRPASFLVWICTWLIVSGGWITPVYGQIWYGVSDDPAEQIKQKWWKNESSIDAGFGLSLIGAQWRFAGSSTARIVTKPVEARLQGTLRTGLYGRYDPDTDEPYDILRLVDFARINPPLNWPVFVRVGSIQRMQMGTGHLINFYDSQTAWDERTIGFTTALHTPHLDLAGFTDNLLLNGVSAGRIALHPFTATRKQQKRNLTVGLNYVNDLGFTQNDDRGIEAYSADVSLNAIQSGAIAFTPFASVAWYRNYGNGLHFGADLSSENFIDLARFRFRMALFYNSERFIPGYFGSFYQVSNPRARILDSEDGDTEIDPNDVTGITLNEALGGNDLLTELRVLFFERFEFWYYFRRHYGTQPLSEYHMRVFLRAPERLELSLGVDRGGLRGFFSLFNDLGDQTALAFDTQYRVKGPVWLFLRSRYTFERIGDLENGDRRFIVQRRFEPLTGIRVSF